MVSFQTVQETLVISVEFCCMYTLLIHNYPFLYEAEILLNENMQYRIHLSFQKDIYNIHSRDLGNFWCR